MKNHSKGCAREVVFRDRETRDIVCVYPSTAPSKSTIILDDGKEYPVVDIGIASIVVPLSWSKLLEAIRLVNRVFPLRNQGKELACIGFAASLCLPGRLIMRLAGYPVVQYWLAVSKSSGEVWGTVGIYARADDPEAYWGGWYCVAPEHRGKATGIQLAYHALNEVRRRGDRSYLRLYTSTDPNEGKAHVIYEKLGCKLYKDESIPGSRLRCLYYQLPLR